MITFQFLDKDVTAPTKWSEVLVEHFIKPEFLSMNAVGLICSLSGIDRKTLLNSKVDIMDSLNKMVEFVAMNPRGYQGPVPETVDIDGTECIIPKDLEVEMVGQKIMLQEAMGKYKFIHEAIPDAIAIYMCPQLNDGEFDDSLIEGIAEKVKQLKIMDVFPIADFFLSSYRNMGRNGSLY